MDLANNVKCFIPLLAFGNITYDYILLPKQNTTKKKQIDKNNALDASNNNSKKSKVRAIWNNTVFI